jgi:hypothetical protein
VLSERSGTCGASNRLTTAASRLPTPIPIAVKRNPRPSTVVAIPICYNRLIPTDQQLSCARSRDTLEGPALLPPVLKRGGANGAEIVFAARLIAFALAAFKDLNDRGTAAA